MFLYNPKRLKKPITLSAKDLSLLRLICDLGFVNDLQIHLLYSVVQRYPSVLSHTILSEWCSFSGLLQKRPKPKSSSSSNVTHAVYIPTNSCRAYLQEQHIPVSMVNDVAVNSHNEQAIEVIVQALYSATFKYATYDTSDSLFSFDNAYVSLSKPEELIKSIYKTRKLNQKSKAPLRNQILFKQKGIISNIKPDYLNQIVQSEKPTGRTLTATESGLLGLWLKRHLIYLRDITNTYSTDLLLPVTTKQLYDSLLDGSITNKQLQFLLNSINYSNTDTNNYSNSLLDSNTLSSNSSSYIREKGLSTSSNAVEARLADSSDYSSDLSELFEDADSNPSDEQLDLFDVSGSSGSKDSDSRSKESSRSRDARSNTEATGKYENSSEKPVKDEISDSQAQLDSLLEGMSDTQKGGNQASSDILGHNENINTNRNKTGTIPERC